MKNQHRRINGYRELTQDEINLMNKIKALGPQIEGVVQGVDAHLKLQRDCARKECNHTEVLRIASAEPTRFALEARNNLQMGLMLLTRAVAQPSFF